MEKITKNKRSEIWNEWKTQEQELRQIRDELFMLLEKKYGEDDGYDKYITMQQECRNHLHNSGLSKEMLEKVIAYHILLGGSPDYNISESFDLEENLSIKKFYSEKLNMEKQLI